ncbi:MAG: exo-alpha-sialidase [Candidatus Eremiobacter antarcticus]|nr:exo-alpha-sialidase [Candidatus Eremiobacteraeota bacterium]MBC5807899.1 exo-alpha-sialidase [Candidatus Eremiobacteraeota bacterium]PZR62731.1 MAG: exo-alpha-sialidase [Candidatus Eremiobacter sp. RRmetagenome_bin22]
MRLTPTPPPSGIVRISADPFTNASSRHASEVEPSAFAAGATIVAAAQAGRFFVAGASDIAFATSLDAGATWTAGILPGTTDIVQPGSPFQSVSDPVVAFDAAHNTWLIGSLPVRSDNGATPAALVSRSSDGVHWNDPVQVSPGQSSIDKDWIGCDDMRTSPFFGHCYLEWDEPAANGLVHMNTSTDGGATWGPIRNTSGNLAGIGGQVIVQPSGAVIVPIDDNTEQNVFAFTSADGGNSWSQAVHVSTIVDHFEGGGLRSGPLVSAAGDAAGNAYAVWQDCRFRARCAANDLVISTSVNGVTWTAPARIPIDALTSSADHFLPGLSVDPATAGSNAHLALTYYYYPNSACTAASCQLFAGFISSPNGGATWSAAVTLAGPMSLSWLAPTNQGPMVGDYCAAAFSAGRPFAIFTAARASAGGLLNEAMYASRVGALGLLSLAQRSSAGEKPIPGIVSDHPPRVRPVRIR